MGHNTGIQAIMQRAHKRRQFLKRSLGAGAAVGATSLVLPRIVEAKTALSMAEQKGTTVAV